MKDSIMTTNMSRIHPSPKQAVRRKRPRSSSQPPTAFLLTALLPFSTGYTITWNFGPEDHFFCGMAWDDYNCPIRQNCRSGKSEECLGFLQGETCFKDTPCDSAQGGGHDFSAELHETYIPTFSPTIYVDKPTNMPVTSGPTLIPTDVPIGPPPDFVWPSDNPSDHWYCGIGIDDANERCGIHCPTASECPVGQICYFGTVCDARTHAPTPPPTNRPTKKPTAGPTVSPTISFSPSYSPTISVAPSSSPSMPRPSKSPTPAPTQSPTHGPLTSIQSGFFCATDWNDAITSCKMRCPSGEDPECPVGEYCFAYTGCTEERGYPNGRPPMRSEASATIEEDSGSEEDKEECLEFKVVIISDDWPAETSWDVKNEDKEIIAEGFNDNLISGESVEFIECLPKNDCMEFTIYDTGGDGLCCSHGEGSYELFYDGEMIKEGGVFYDSDAWTFGRCQDTPAPVYGPSTPSPSAIKVSRPLGDASIDGTPIGGGSNYRCVQQSLLDRGYVIDSALCPRFTDCYNKFIGIGDDWFCKSGETCTESPNCGSRAEADSQTILPEEKNTVTEEDQTGFEDTNTEPYTQVGRPPTASEFVDLTPVGRPLRPNPSTSALIVSNPTLAPMSATPAPIANTPAPVVSTFAPLVSTDEPTSATTSLEPSLTPTTSRPTQGLCDGLPCNRDDYCRSEHGFCGPDKGYCNEKSIWTKDCTQQPTPTPSFAVTTPNPTYEPSTKSAKPTFMKSSGGKGAADTGSEEEISPPTSSPIASKGLSLGTVNFFSLSSGSEEVIQIITDAPTPSPQTSKDISDETNNPVLDSAADEDDYEFECIGEPCDQDAWCRSIFGSCGPGFIYCNAKSIWTSSCRITHTDMTFSKVPLEGLVPSSELDKEENAIIESSMESGMANNTAPSPIPGLPELSKPTLPTISDANYYTSQDAFATHFMTADSSRQKDETDVDNYSKDGDQMSSLNKPTEEKQKKEPYSYSTVYDSPEYSKHWSEWAKSVQSSALKNYSYKMLYTALSLSVILFCA